MIHKPALINVEGKPWREAFKVRSESLDTKFSKGENAEDIREILKIPFVNCGYCVQEYFLRGEE